MGYELHITRAEDWTESEKHPISREEWETFARHEPSLTEAGTIGWLDIGDQPIFGITDSDGTEASLTWREGRVTVAGAYTAQLERAIATMAQDLQGILVGDDGDRYLVDGYERYPKVRSRSPWSRLRSRRR